jgi:hypothetical protein
MCWKEIITCAPMRNFCDLQGQHSSAPGLRLRRQCAEKLAGTNFAVLRACVNVLLL